jgi:hypothetical protein
MLDVDTFLTTLYVIVDDFCHSHHSRQRRPGPEASLSAGEVITLAIFARWSRFSSERDFYRYAEVHLRGAFPTLPERSQFNRLVRFYAEAIEEIALHLGQTVEGDQSPYQALDASAMPVRDAKRRGHGWLAGYADIGWSNSLGWYEGFSLLIAVEPSGVITGFCFGAASTAEQPLAETFFNLRTDPNPRLKSVGSAFSGAYVAYPRALRAPKTTGAGWRATVQMSSIRPSATPRSEAGPSVLEGGLPASGRSSRPFLTSSSTPSASGKSGPMSLKVCAPAWRRGWRCTTSVSGSTTSSADLG